MTDASNDLNTLARLSVSDFVNRYKGVGMAKAASIIAAMELGAPPGIVDGKGGTGVNNQQGFVRLSQPLIGDLDHEEFWVSNLIKCLPN